jgi:hypothetical protein
MKRAIGSHERPNEGATNNWITPKHIIDALGPFDLDPCASVQRPYDCALENYTVEDDGLEKAWFGTVWVNPPYGPHMGPWLERLAEHDNGFALVFCRTETRAIQPVMSAARSILFIRNRLMFLRPDGTAPPGNAGAPSMILAFGEECDKRLRNCELPGILMKHACRYCR